MIRESATYQHHLENKKSHDALFGNCPYLESHFHAEVAARVSAHIFEKIRSNN